MFAYYNEHLHNIFVIEIEKRRRKQGCGKKISQLENSRLACIVTKLYFMLFSGKMSTLSENSNILKAREDIFLEQAHFLPVLNVSALMGRGWTYYFL